MNWTAEHQKTYRSIKALKHTKRVKEKELDLIKTDYERQINELEKNISDMQKRCRHIDDGGPFIATCSVCGWADYYGDC